MFYPAPSPHTTPTQRPPHPHNAQHTHHTFHNNSKVQNSKVYLFFDHNNVFDENKQTKDYYATYVVFIIILQKPTEAEIKYFQNEVTLASRHFAVQVQQVLVQQGSSPGHGRRHLFRGRCRCRGLQLYKLAARGAGRCVIEKHIAEGLLELLLELAGVDGLQILTLRRIYVQLSGQLIQAVGLPLLALPLVGTLRIDIIAG